MVQQDIYDVSLQSRTKAKALEQVKVAADFNKVAEAAVVLTPSFSNKITRLPPEIHTEARPTKVVAAWHLLIKIKVAKCNHTRITHHTKSLVAQL
jgi:hypothetical protein